MLEKSIEKLQEAMQEGTLTSRNLSEQAFKRIEQTSSLNIYCRLMRESALKQAEGSDARRKKNKTLGPLDGIPLGIKDNILIENQVTSACSKMLSNFVAPIDAEVIRRLKKAGAVLVGQTNMDEFAMGSSTEHSCFGPTLNPHDSTRISGGSSGGSAAAVAAQTCVAALGSDTGGSVRQPAAFCGVVGLKPTYGRISRRGVIAFASSFDQVGPIAKSVSDCEVLYRVLAGHDAKESTSAKREVKSSEPLESLAGVKFAIPQCLAALGIADDVLNNFHQTLEHCKQAGAEIVEIDFPHWDYAISTYYVLATSEASSNLARFDGVRYGYRATSVHSIEELYAKSRGEGFGREVQRRIMLGTFSLSADSFEAYYLRAQKVRTLILNDFLSALNHSDAIITPTAPTVAYKVGALTSDPIARYLGDRFTAVANITGLPALSFPDGRGQGNMPTGVQLLGSAWSEHKLFEYAKILEKSIAFNGEVLA